MKRRNDLSKFREYYNSINKETSNTSFTGSVLSKGGMSSHAEGPRRGQKSSSGATSENEN